MPDWRLPGEIQRDGAAFTKLMHALFGLYAYEPITHVLFPRLLGLTYSLDMNGFYRLISTGTFSQERRDSVGRW